MENISNFTEMSIDVWKDSFVYDLSIVIVSSFLILFGVPGNCLILRVYWTKTRKTSTHVLIMALAWADLTVCLLKFATLIDATLALTSKHAENILVFRFIDATSNVTVAYSVFITMLIALDRYDCICRPQRRFLNPRRSKTAARVALVVSFVIAIPSFLRIKDWSEPVLFKAKVALETVALVPMTLAILVSYGKVYTTIRKHVRVGVDGPPMPAEDSLKGVSKWSVNLPETAQQSDKSGIANVDKPMTSLSIHPGVDKNVSSASDHPSTSHSNQTKINHADSPPNVIHNSANKKCFSQNNQETLTSKKDDHATCENRLHCRGRSFGIQHVPQRPGGAVLQRKTTRMLFITSLVFILSWLPYFIWADLNLLRHAGAAINIILLRAFNVVSFTLYINSAINPLIYGLANRRFRQDFKKELCKIKLCSD